MAIMSAIAGVAGIAGSYLSNKAQSKSTKQAANIAAQTAAMNNALTERIFSQNQAALAPYQQRGNQAGSAINALLGLADIQQPQQPAQATYQGFGGSPYSGGVPASPVNLTGGTIDVGNPRVNALLGEQGQFDMATGLPLNGGDYGSMQLGGLPAPVTTAAPATNALSQYQQAFDNYRNSTGYQFRLNEGNKAIGANFAARGLNNSGAAVRRAMDYGQNIASGEFGNYLGYLSNQQGVGFGAASAQAGVGQNYVNTVSANNNNAGSAAANAALLRGQANANMWGGILQGAGNIFGSSFGFGG